MLYWQALRSDRALGSTWHGEPRLLTWLTHLQPMWPLGSEPAGGWTISVSPWLCEAAFSVKNKWIFVVDVVVVFVLPKNRSCGPGARTGCWYHWQCHYHNTGPLSRSFVGGGKEIHRERAQPRAQVLDTCLAAFPGVLQGTWIGWRTARTQTRQLTTHCATILALLGYFKLCKSIFLSKWKLCI